MARYIRKCGLTPLNAVHEVIRVNIGYGRFFTRHDLLSPLSATSGIRYPVGVDISDLLNDLASLGGLKKFHGDEPKYLLIRTDNRKEPVVGFNPWRE